MTPTQTAAARVSGTIKALEWVLASSPAGTWLSVSIAGDYVIRPARGSTEARLSTPTVSGWTRHRDVGAAKAAAQADYNARILAAIQPDPEPVVQCCMCGKKGLSTVEGDGGEECQLDDDRWMCSRVCYDKATDPDPQPVASEPVDKCANCGATGHRCYGSDDAGPDHMDWIGQNGGREYCHACFKHPATPSSAGTVSVEAWSDEVCLRFAEGYDREDAAQIGEPSPHDKNAEGYAEWAADRIACVRAALRALAGEGGR